MRKHVSAMLYSHCLGCLPSSAPFLSMDSTQVMIVRVSRISWRYWRHVLLAGIPSTCYMCKGGASGLPYTHSKFCEWYCKQNTTPSIILVGVVYTTLLTCQQNCHICMTVSLLMDSLELSVAMENSGKWGAPFTRGTTVKVYRVVARPCFTACTTDCSTCASPHTYAKVQLACFLYHRMCIHMNGM